MTQFKCNGSLSSTTIGISLICCLSSVAIAEPHKDDTSRGRVIYNLDCTEYFRSTFGPNVPQTIDKFVEDHAKAGITELWINVNAQRTNYRSDVWEAWWMGTILQPAPTSRFSQELLQGELPDHLPTTPRCSSTCGNCMNKVATIPNGCSKVHAVIASGHGSPSA